MERRLAGLQRRSAAQDELITAQGQRLADLKGVTLVNAALPLKLLAQHRALEPLAEKLERQGRDLAKVRMHQFHQADAVRGLPGRITELEATVQASNRAAFGLHRDNKANADEQNKKIDHLHHALVVVQNNFDRACDTPGAASFLASVEATDILPVGRMHDELGAHSILDEPPPVGDSQ
jgi:hypothetical protein